MHRIAVFVYGVLSYTVFFATFLYAIGFVGGFGVPRSIDSAAEGAPGIAVLVDVLLLAVFALQHSLMARPAFKRWWTQIVPEAAERSTYVLASSLAAPTGPEHTRGVIRTIRDLEQIERDSIVAALEAAGGRVAGADGAAERLGTKPSTLRSRMKALGIGRTD